MSVRDAKELNCIEGMEYIASVPKSEEITGMVVHKGEIFVSTKNHIYTLKDNKRLERID